MVGSAASEAPKLIYVVVVDGGEDGRGGGSFRYTRPVLQSTLQLMGCKPRHAFKISRTAYEVIQSKCSFDGSGPDDVGILSGLWEGGIYKEIDSIQDDSSNLRERRLKSAPGILEASGSIPFEWYKKQTTAFVTRETFLNIVCDALSEYKYFGPNQRADLVLACRIRERKESVTVLLCGTSGCGKSTLSALLHGDYRTIKVHVLDRNSRCPVILISEPCTNVDLYTWKGVNRLGITTVISTDSVRHMMRSFVDEEHNPLLWASTYHAGECLDPVAVAQARAKRKAIKLDSLIRSSDRQELTDGALNKQHDSQFSGLTTEAEIISKKQMAIEGYKAQSEMIIDSLDRLISAWEDKKESAIIEGVHLSLNFVMGLMKKHPCIIPFMIYIANEGKHVERFAIRAKYMTLDPARNKYVKYIRNIRTIQEYLCNRADKHLVPKINNTNVDRSVAAIHATVFSILRRREAGEELYDSLTNTVPIINGEFRKQLTANSMSSKGMLKLIQRQGSFRRMMALINTDGSVTKVWPVESADVKVMSGDAGKEFLSSPIYHSLQVGNAETVNLQFGTYGISAWSSDAAGTSRSGNIDEDDSSDAGSKQFSSYCSSPRILEGPAKELMDDISVPDSEEEAADVQSNGDQSDEKEIAEELEGSVDEGSGKSDEEYEDLALQDDNGYRSDDPDPNNSKKPSEKKLTRDTVGKIIAGDLKNQHNLQKCKVKVRATGPSCPRSLLSEQLENMSSRMKKKHLSNGSLRSFRRAQSIPASTKPGM